MDAYQFLEAQNQLIVNNENNTMGVSLSKQTEEKLDEILDAIEKRNGRRHRNPCSFERDVKQS